ncbi:radical SAM protein [Nocardia sp. NPDC003345]
MQCSTTSPLYAEFVVKVSKFCNLRCNYCYEYPWLADKSSMSLPDIEAMLRNIGRYFASQPRRLDFVWHGGEPLLLGLEYYKRIIDIQHAVLDPLGLPFNNSIQSNLTTVRPADMPELSEMFGEIGVSVDLFGGNRINSRGVDSQPKVLRLMQELLDVGLPFGCITVLSQDTAPHVQRIYEFFEDIGVSFRLLPIYRTGFAGQQEKFELTSEQIVAALKTVTDRWFESESPIKVEPIESYISNVLARVQRSPLRHYDKESSEAVFIIDTDGSVYSNGDAYDASLCHGNIFRDPFELLRCSPGFERALIQSRLRVGQACANCEFFGACSGYFVAEATPEQRWRDSNGRVRCGVAAPMHAYIEDRLRGSGLLTSTNTLDREILRARAGGAVV